MKYRIGAALLAISLAGLARSQTVEFRIVERQGQADIPNPVGSTSTTDNVLNFAVQGRVVGGSPTQFLGNFQFDIVATGEADANGTLAKLLISNFDGTYDPNPTQSVSGTVGRGGLAAIYTYLADVSPSFNGLINTSSGSFTNTPDNQEIGQVSGAPEGGPLLLLTDTMGTGNPDTYPGTGNTAPIDPTVASTYLGANGNFVDVYRFQYTVGDTTVRRAITFHLNVAGADIGTGLMFASGIWSPVQSGATFSVSSVIVQVDGLGACCASAGTCSVTGSAACTGPSYLPGGSCSPNPCPQMGTCCAVTGVCTTSLQSACAPGSVWTVGGVCSPNPCPQPGACCAATGACSLTLQATCAAGSSWSPGGTCAINPCPQPGTCCASTGTCTFGFLTICTGGGVWTQGGACSPNLCPQPGTCCSAAGSCAFELQSACVGGSVWTQGRACSPNPCSLPGTCCAPAGTCMIGLQAACTNGSVWSSGGSCSPNPCPQPGTCCAATGTCSFGPQSLCGGGSVWAQGGTCSPNPCPQPGSCCAMAGSCTVSTQSACVAGSVWTLGGACAPNLCPQPGACCDLSGSCAFLLQSACMGVAWSPSGSCSPNPCPVPTVEFRIVERHATPITTVLAGTNVLNYAVQARVTGVPNVGLSSCAFHIEMTGEAESSGMLALNTISNPDGTYWSGAIDSTLATGGHVTGMAFAYRYLVSINSEFNGLINGSGGSWMNNPSQQDIGLIAEYTANTGYLTYTDPLGHGYPDNPLNPATELNPWFGANGNWIDIYRFQYTVSNLSVDRTIPVDLVLDGAPAVFSGSQFADGIWRPLDTSVANTPTTGTTFTVVYLGACCASATAQCTATAPTGCSGGTFQGSGTTCSPTLCPGGACCTPSNGTCTFTGPAGCSASLVYLGTGTTCQANPCPVGSCCGTDGSCTTTLQVGCSASWTASGTCVPNACPQPGACCATTGTCVYELQALCAGPNTWSAGGSCSPNTCPQPGACCAASGACAPTLQSTCANAWVQGVCSPNPCPQPGPCCASDGSCALALQIACIGTWSQGGNCVPNPCPQPGACCTSTGSCSIVLQTACPAGDLWTRGGACAPNPCPQPGSCCAADGSCTLSFPAACGGLWTLSGACAPNTCTQPHTVVVRTVRAAGSTSTPPWTMAVTSLQSALSASLPGDEVWVAGGTYAPAVQGPSNSGTSFSIPSGVRVYGGFVGTETARSQRNPDPTVSESVLTGLDWFNQVVTVNSASQETVLDGLTITHGRGAPYFANASTTRWEGAGLFVSSCATVLVSNCTFSFNQSGQAPTTGLTDGSRGGQGGGAYVLNSGCRFQNCRFLDNSCGSGSPNNCESGTTGPAGDGGNGGAVSIVGSLASFADCQFSSNGAGAGSPASSCFAAGAGGAGGAGGAVYAANSTSTFARCSFLNNSAGNGGGGGTNFGGQAAANGVGGGGGAVRIAAGSANFTSCTFVGNVAGNGASPAGTAGAAGAAGGSGGAVGASAAQVTLLDSVFGGNLAGNGGPAGNDSTLTCARAGGDAGTGGAVALSGGSTISVVACTFSQNAPGSPGTGAPALPPNCGSGPAGAVGTGGIASDTLVTIADSILWNNSSEQMSAPSSSVQYSCVQGGAAGVGNIGTDPLFLYPTAGDYRLAPNSPCIDTASNTFLPASLAADASGNPRYVGACGTLPDDGPTPPSDMGAYEYQSAGTDCNQDGVCDLRQVTGIQVLEAPVPTPGDLFGWKVSLYGNSALIGARATSTSAGVGAGAAYFYSRQGAMWGDVQTLVSPSAAAGDDFGNWSALNDQWAFVGARFAHVSGLAGAGAVFVYQPGMNGWVQSGRLTAPDAVENGEFGHGIALDGSRVVVGSLHATSSGVADCGAAYVYLYNGAGWALETKLVPADPTSGKGFGICVSISGDTIVVGAPYDGNTGTAGGAVYVFQRFAGGWVQIAKVLPTDTASLVNANFGELVTISGDRFLAGATRLSFMGQSRAGAAYVFRHAGSAWVQEQRLTSDIPMAEEWFGFDLTFDGAQAVIGGFRRTVGGQSLAGSAYVYRRFGSLWLLASRIDAPDPLPTGSFGYSVGLNGTHAIIGELRNQSGQLPGVARVFDLGLLDGNHNGIPDSCEIASGAALDRDHNGIPDNVQFDPCRADFNSDGQLSVQDIFDFLTAWFSNDPRADIDGGGLSVQDIFYFLTGWFAGCP